MLPILAEKDICSGCGACSAACNLNAISMIKDTDGFPYPEIDETICNECGRCDNTCPAINIDKIKDKPHKIKTFAGYLTDEKELKKSASGGAFMAIATMVLNREGFVCGVVYSDDFKSAYHICSDEFNIVLKMRGSKYIQSDITDELYSKLKDLLKQGKIVFFTGLPCQVSALKRYLRKDYDNLITCDLICYGPTSSFVQREYVHHLESQYSSKVVDFNARYKKGGWKTPYLKVTFENGRVYCKPMYDTYFGFAVFGLGLRPSCYNCKFKNFSWADITIGDFWGIDGKSEYYNKFGTSVLIANSVKGIIVIEELGEFRVYESDYDLACKGNPRLLTPTPKNPNRKLFFDIFQSDGLVRACNKFDKPKLYKAIYKLTPKFVINVLKKIKNKK